jgi:DNA-binding GntR family transcriptional regulator
MTTAPPPLLRYRDPGLIRDRVVEALREAIVEGRLPPGARVRERELVLSLGVSRSPLREAIRVLEGEGLLTTARHRGASVTDLSVEDLRHTTEVRIMLETFAVRRAGHDFPPALLETLAEQVRQGTTGTVRQAAAAELDYSIAFHDAIVAASGNPRVIQLFQIVKRHLRRYQLLAFARLDRAARANDEHAEILAALRHRDVPAVEGLLAAHIARASGEIAAHLARDLPVPAAP